jgi:DNA-binding GntR family transcriptional regulator
MAVTATPLDGLLRTGVYDELRQRFVTGKVMPGASLATRQVAAELGVSQMPVREALSRLAAEGAVEIRSKRRIVVPAMNAKRFGDVLRCRELLEPEAAVLALRHIDSQRVERLEAADAALGEALQCEDVESYMERNFEFHFLIYRALPRPTMTRLIETLWLQFGPHMRVVYGEIGTRHLVDQHERAVAAIRAKNARALRAAILADIRDGMGLIGSRGFDGIG